MSSTSTATEDPRKARKRAKRAAAAAAAAASSAAASASVTGVAAVDDIAESDGGAREKPAAADGAAAEDDDPRKARKRARRATEVKATSSSEKVVPGSIREGSCDGDVLAPAAGDDGHARTVYVEGISYDAAEADVEALFGTCGGIVEVRMPRFQDSGRPMGYAHVEYTDASSVQAALALSGEYIKERYVTVSAAKARERRRDTAAPQPAGCTTLFVSNLPYDTTEDVVRETFGCGCEFWGA